MTQAAPRYKYGVIGPVMRDPTAGSPMAEPLLPPDVVRVATGIGIKDYTTEGVEDGMSRYWDCVDYVMKGGAQRTFLAGFPIAAQLGRERALKTFAETSRKTGVPASSDAEATIECMKHFGVTRIAVASRWAPEMNDLLIKYLTDAGFEVLYITTAGQWAAEAFAMSIEEGIKKAFQLAREAMKNAPQAEGLLMPGGTWRILAAIPVLEDDFAQPIFSNPTAVPWRLMHDGIAPAVPGWGRVLANP